MINRFRNLNRTVARGFPKKFGKELLMAEFQGIIQASKELTLSEFLYRCHSCKRSASGILLEARIDSGQAGMTNYATFTNDHIFLNLNSYKRSQDEA
jgi:hypothetical protein